MRHRHLAATLGLALIASTATAGVSIGEKLEPFALKDAVSGKDVDLKSVAGKKATVLMFIATQCPVSNAYNDRMAAVAKDYTGKGVAFVGINSNRQEAVEEIADHAKKNAFSFPVLKDAENAKADQFGAAVTPEIYVYDANWKLQYHGRIDDNQAGTNIKNNDLRAALDALVDGKPVPVAETKAFGCTIKRVKKAETSMSGKADAAKPEGSTK
jgi:thiol-disulfide isomerase/thioredoxin